MRSSFLLRESENFLLPQISNSSCQFLRLSNISKTFSIPEMLYIPQICQRPCLSVDISEIFFIPLIYPVSSLFLRDSKISSIFRSINYFSPNWPTGLIQSSSSKVSLSVCVSVCLSPSHAILPGEQRRCQGSKAGLHRGITTSRNVHNYDWQSPTPIN